MRELNKVINKNTNEEESAENLLGKIIKIKIDRPIGTVHPTDKDIIYEVNYGFYEDYISSDNNPLDAYIVGESLPLHVNDEYEGKVIAIIHRLNDIEDKLVVAPIGREVSKDEIITKTNFVEQYFVSEIIF